MNTIDDKNDSECMKTILSWLKINYRVYILIDKKSQVNQPEFI